jgi:hypothetical protein
VNSQAEFVVRPSLDGSGRPLIEFRGDHRSGSYPDVLGVLASALPGFAASADAPVMDDVVWHCRYVGGAFDLCDDWGGLFVLAASDHERIIEAVAAALARTTAFRRVDV